MSSSSNFTLARDERVNAIISSALAALAAECAASVECENLEFLVLGGGYGRGEGGVLVDSNGSVRPYNDLDFFVISKDSDPEKNAALDRFFEALAAKLSPKLEVDVDFSKARSSDYVASHLNVLMWREMVLGATLTVGDSAMFEKKFGLSKDAKTEAKKVKVPPAEFAKMIFNRFAGLLFARRRLFEKKELSLQDKDFICRNINKAVLAVGDAYLASLGIYELHSFDRLSRLNELDKRPDVENLAAMYARAFEFKKYPKLNKSREEIEADFSEALNLAERALRRLESFLSSHVDLGFAGIMRLRVKNFITDKYFSQAKPYVGGIFSNPFVRGSELALKMASQVDEDFSEESAKEFEKIWQTIN